MRIIREFFPEYASRPAVKTQTEELPQPVIEKDAKIEETAEKEEETESSIQLPQLEEDESESAIPLHQLEETPDQAETEAATETPGAAAEPEEAVGKDFINCTIAPGTKQNMLDEISYRLKNGESFLDMDIVIEERLAKSPWSPPETEPALTDTTKKYFRKYRRSAEGKKEYLYCTILKDAKQNLQDERDYRDAHCEPKLPLSHVFEECMIKAWFNLPGETGKPLAAENN